MHACIRRRMIMMILRIRTRDSRPNSSSMSRRFNKKKKKLRRRRR
jgi:hypothetical protein